MFYLICFIIFNVCILILYLNSVKERNKYRKDVISLLKQINDKLDKKD